MNWTEDGRHTGWDGKGMKELTEMRGSMICFVILGSTASAARFKVVESLSGMKEDVTIKVWMLNSSGLPTQGPFGLSEFTWSSFLLYLVLVGVDVMTAILMHLTVWLPSLALFGLVEMTHAGLLTWGEQGNDVVALVVLTSSSVILEGRWSSEGILFFPSFCIPALTHWANRQALW